MKLNRFSFLNKGFLNPAIIGILLSMLSVLITYSKNWVLTKSFVPEEFGYFIYISTIIGWVVTITTSGLNNGLLSYFITFDKRAEIKNIVGWVLGLSIKRGIIGIIIAIIFFFLFILPKSNDYTFLYFTLSLLIPISISISILSYTLIYQGSVILNNVVNIIFINGFTLLLFVLFYFYDFDFYTLAIAVSLPALLAFVFLLIKTKYLPIFDKKVIDKRTKKTILSTSNKILFSGLLYAFWIKAESFFLEINCGTDCIAYFYVPFQFAFLLTMVNTVMYGIVSAKLAHYEDSFDEQETLYHNSSLFSFYVNLILFFFLYINAHDLLMIFGSIYANDQSVLAIKILSFSFLLYSYFGSTAEVFMNMLNRNIYLLYSAVLTFVISIIANLIFTLQIGIEGASISFLITITSTSIIRSYYMRKKFLYKISIFSPVMKYVIISIPILEFLSYLSFKINNMYFRIAFCNSILCFFVVLILVFNYNNVLRFFNYFMIKN